MKLSGVIIIHPASGFPHVEFTRGEDVVSAIVYVDQLKAAEANVGKKVTFKLLDHPYGPDISSEVAYIITELDFVPANIS